MVDNIWFDSKTERELENKAKVENFQNPQDLVKFLVSKALSLNIKRTYEPADLSRKRPSLAVGDKVRLTKRARNKSCWGVRNATMAVVKVDTTVLNPIGWRGWHGGVHSDGESMVALCGRGSKYQDRRVDPSNGYCEITVAYKHGGKWHKTTHHRKDLYKVSW
jgi:hypothetical protein